MKLFQAYHFLLLVILVSSTTVGSVVPKYAKKGCKDICGNVKIPFPFGIGASCSVNEWYNVDCNSSTPYLSSFNQLEVLRVDLKNRTVTVKMQKFSNCSQTTKSVDLGSSPFLYSKSHNTLIYEGYCGNVVMMDNHGSVLSGCSTTCSNDTTTTGISDTSNCFGVNCCQTDIPQYLKSYSINLTGTERQKGGDVACGSAYLLDKNYSYTEGSHLSSPSAKDGTSYTPTSLQWILSYHDYEQLSCSGQWYPSVMDLGNGTLIISLYCYTYGLSTIEGNPYLIDGYGTGTLKYTKPGCKDTCGNNVVIPYPFGIGASCSVNEWYTVDCKSSKPYLSALNHLEVLGIDLDYQIITVNMQKFSNCSQVINSVDLGRSPFLYSKSHNKFVYEGYCGNAFMMDDQGSFLTGCSTACYNDTTTVIMNAKKCFGINCCQTTIPYYLKSYRMNFTALENQIGGDGGCGSAFLVDQNLYAEGSSSNVPTSLLWTLSGHDIDQITCCDGNKPTSSRKVDLGSGTPVDTWKCSMTSIYDTGNPYLVDGCAAIDEGLDTEECARCKNSGGHCGHNKEYDVDDYVYKDNIICYGGNESKTSLRLILGVTMSDYLKKPLLRKKVNIEKGDKYPEGHVSGVYVTKPLESNTQVPEKTEELKKVEVPDNKVLAAKDRKKEQTTKAGLKKPPPKRTGGNISQRVQKRTKVADDTPVIDLDTAGDIPEPVPIRSIPSRGSGAEGTGDQTGGSGVGGSKGGSSRPGKETMVEEDMSEDTSGAPFVPEWSVKRGTRMNNANVCRDMMINLATPEEESYLDQFKDGEAIQRAWLSLGKHATAQADVIFRFESILLEHRKLAARFDGMSADFEKIKEEHAGCSNKDPEELAKLRLEHAGCSERELSLTGRVSDLEKEKEEWREVSAEQAEKIKALEAELGKVKLALSEEEEEYKKLLQEKQEAAIRAGNAEIDRNRVVSEFLPAMVRRLLGSHEFKTTLSEPFNLFYQSGLIDGANLGNEPEEAVRLLETAVEGIDLDADQKYQTLFDQALSTDYPYVQKVSQTRFRSFAELMAMFPDAAPAEIDPATNVIGTSGTDSDGQQAKERSTADNPADQDDVAPGTSAPVS